ncbi:hypothetical protein GMA92_11830 [Turicibacter sanguinis]|uniref:Uncharacterized protein n=1 Tax=Turicibacter sanguinis TaxID=154288 RepID=A0A9X4XFM1_9FIRM|nr:hypothetical protein [Turicibacter sanguinis]MTK22098.1 hypothetical protein [Turicibacter sanguinis]MTK72453.1 hypothetical protein [Turicibacter sanguinis]MTN45982.1 hypothetical protein [Turicibacter sanguinis]MTN51824.1 hypothetical protein [Turicibacter sanguinis]MTN53791.1 hypothetical protein [Turicibacter sanguinis]
MDYYYQADILFKTGHKEKIERVQQISLFNPDTQKYEKIPYTRVSAISEFQFINKGLLTFYAENRVSALLDLSEVSLLKIQVIQVHK